MNKSTICQGSGDQNEHRDVRSLSIGKYYVSNRKPFVNVVSVRMRFVILNLFSITTIVVDVCVSISRVSTAEMIEFLCSR